MARLKALFFIFLILLPIGYAITFYADEQSTLFASCKNLSYTESLARITIRYPNNTIWIANESMSAYSTGQFNYTFISPNVTGNYVSEVICNISGVMGYDEENFWVKDKEEEMTSVAVVIFLVLITGGLFILPKAVPLFSKNKYADKVLKGLCIVFGLFLLSLDTAMVVSVADKAKLGINKELFTLLFLVNWAAYLAILIVILSFGYNMLKMWGIEKKNRREGVTEDESFTEQ